MTSPSQSRHPHEGHGAAEREIARAEADYQRLRQAYLELAKGEHNEVALAMVGADMERANATLLSLSGLQQSPARLEADPVARRQARRLAEENA